MHNIGALYPGMLTRPAKCKAEAEAKTEARYHKAKVARPRPKKCARPRSNTVRPRLRPEMPY